MKKGYKICPHCWKEIKSVAIKCQYCLKFLDEEPEKKTKECPFCLNEININEKKCPHCDEILETQEKVFSNKFLNILSKWITGSKKYKLLKYVIYFSSSVFLLNILTYFFGAIWRYLVNNVPLGTSILEIPWDLFSTHQFFWHYVMWIQNIRLALIIGFIVYIVILYSLRKHWYKICFCLFPFSIISTFIFFLWLIKHIFF